MYDPFYNLYNIIINNCKNSKYDLSYFLFSNLGDNNPLLLDNFNGKSSYHSLEDFYSDAHKRKIIFHDQEPIVFTQYKNDWKNKITWFNRLETNHILSNSEKNSEEKNILLEKSNWHDFYWFSNGFLSLEWYRFYRYATHLENSWNPSKTFSSYNRIMPNREHRLILSGYLQKHFFNKSIISCHNITNLNKNNTFPMHHNEYINSVEDFYLDDEGISNFSFQINENHFTDSFCHIITERIFYEERIHLTEKTFRPIICCRPFILVSSKDSLKYLKNYGFKTFNKFWSEEYDDISDHHKRLDAILEIIHYLGSLNQKQIKNMLIEMQEILLFNRKHFFNDFQKILLEELYDNLKASLEQKNNCESYYKKIVNSLTDAELDYVKNYNKVCDVNDDNAKGVFNYYIKNLLVTSTDKDIVRPFVKTNAEYFLGFLQGVNYCNL